MGQTLPPFTRSQHSDEPTGGKGMKGQPIFRQLHVKKYMMLVKQCQIYTIPNFTSIFFRMVVETIPSQRWMCWAMKKRGAHDAAD